MPLTKAGKKVLASMRKQYGERAEEVFYASINAKKPGSTKWHRSPDRYADDRPMVEPPRTEYHAQQEGLEAPSGKGKPAGGTENLRVTSQTKQAAQPTSPSGSKNKWPAGVDSYTDDVV